MKDYVYIQSTTTITVTAGLQNENVTNKDAHVPDRLKVNPLWPKMSIMIKEGRHIYPSLIVEWPTVKALVKDNILTIGEYVNDTDDTKMKAKTEDIKTEMKKIKDITLEEAAKNDRT